MNQSYNAMHSLTTKYNEIDTILTSWGKKTHPNTSPYAAKESGAKGGTLHDAKDITVNNDIGSLPLLFLNSITGLSALGNS